MVNLILSPILDSSAILDKVKKNYNLTSKHLLIVPDNFTLAYEKQGLDYLGVLGAFDFEVTDFENLADRFLDKKALRLLDKQSGVMLLRKIIEENKADLRCFKGATNLIGFAEEMFDAIMKIRESGVEVDSLTEIAVNDDKLTIKLKNKTYDIALLYKKYVEAIQEGCIDGTSKLKLFAKLIPESKIADYHVYISDYTFFTKSMYDVMQQLMSTALSFNICVLNSNNKNGYIYPNTIKDKIINIAEAAGQKVNIIEYEPKLIGDFDRLYPRLFSYEKETNPVSNNNIEIHTVSNIESEVRYVAREINKLIKAGKRYKDISIVCCNLESYQDVIKKVFNDYDISYYCDIKAKLMNQALTNTVFAALKVIIGRYSELDVRAFVKQLLPEIDYKDACTFENFVLEYGIDYNKFKEPFEKKDSMDDDVYEVAEIVRAQIIKLLRTFTHGQGLVSDFVHDIKGFLEKNQLEKINSELCDKQLEDGFIVESKITAQCYDMIMKILDQAEAIMGQNRMNLKTFYSILQSVVDSTEISCVPIYVDSVFIGDEGSSKFEPCSNVFVMGASEGNFPTQSADAGIIADREIEAWAKCDITIEPDTKTRNRQQKLNTLLTLLKAKQKLVITYPVVNSQNEMQYGSETIESIEKICGIKRDHIESLKGDVTDEELYENISVEKNALEEFLMLIRDIKDNKINLTDNLKKMLDILYFMVCKQYGKAKIDNILEGGNVIEDKITNSGDFVWNNNFTSPSQIEKYFKCPFKHFIDYYLRAKRREVANLQVNDIGTILHAIMEKYFSRDDSCDIDNDEIKKRVRQIFDEIAQEDVKLQVMMTQTDGLVIKMGICHRAIFLIEELVKKMQCTQFRPVACEKKFGFNEPDSLDSVQISAKNRVINIKGVIDRIDRIGEQDPRFYVIDYKSRGSIEFKPSNILFGDRVQLAIYLMALMKSKSLTPAGMFYMLMPDKFEKKSSNGEKSRYKYIGYVDANDESMPYVDKTLVGATSTSSSLYNLKVDKDGNAQGSILNEEDLVNCVEYVKKLISNAVDEIDDGYIAPRPLCESLDDYNSPCKYCDYKTICGIQDKPSNIRKEEKFKIEDMRNIIGGDDERDFME